MATANVTRSSSAAPRFTFRPASAKQMGACPVPMLELLQRLNDAEIIALLDSTAAPLLERQLVLSIHRFLRTPKRERQTLRLADAWIRAYPDLVGARSLTRCQRNLVSWTDCAAEAYLRAS